MVCWGTPGLYFIVRMSALANGLLSLTLARLKLAPGFGMLLELRGKFSKPFDRVVNRTRLTEYFLHGRQFAHGLTVMNHPRWCRRDAPRPLPHFRCTSE